MKGSIHAGESGLEAASRASTARPSSGPWQYRHVVWNFAQRDLKARYKSTFLGWFWSLLVPLATVATYTLVFSMFFRAAPPDMGNGRSGIFSVWFFTGLVAWSFLNVSITRAMGSLLSAGRLLQKIYLPGYVPVLGTVTGVAVQLVIEFGVLLLILIALGNVSPVWLATPLWFALYLPFVASLAVVMALCNVFVRDLSVMISVVLQLLFFLTPIIYPISFIPESVNGIPLRAIIEASPFASFIGASRDLVYENTLPSAQAWLYLAGWSAAALCLALFCYRRWGRDLAELL